MTRDEAHIEFDSREYVHYHSFIDEIYDSFEKDIIHKFEGTSKYWLEHKFIEEVSKLDRGMYEVIIRKVK